MATTIAGPSGPLFPDMIFKGAERPFVLAEVEKGALTALITEIVFGAAKCKSIEDINELGVVLTTGAYKTDDFCREHLSGLNNYLESLPRVVTPTSLEAINQKIERILRKIATMSPLEKMTCLYASLCEAKLAPAFAHHAKLSETRTSLVRYIKKVIFNDMRVESIKEIDTLGSVLKSGIYKTDAVWREKLPFLNNYVACLDILVKSQFLRDINEVLDLAFDETDREIGMMVNVEKFTILNASLRRIVGEGASSISPRLRNVTEIRIENERLLLSLAARGSQNIAKEGVSSLVESKAVAAGAGASTMKAGPVSAIHPLPKPLLPSVPKPATTVELSGVKARTPCEAVKASVASADSSKELVAPAIAESSSAAVKTEAASAAPAGSKTKFYNIDHDPLKKRFESHDPARTEILRGLGATEAQLASFRSDPKKLMYNNTGKLVLLAEAGATLDQIESLKSPLKEYIILNCTEPLLLMERGVLFSDIIKSTPEKLNADFLGMFNSKLMERLRGLGATEAQLIGFISDPKQFILYNTGKLVLLVKAGATLDQIASLESPLREHIFSEFTEPLLLMEKGVLFSDIMKLTPEKLHADYLAMNKPAVAPKKEVPVISDAVEKASTT